ncbi:hypothetical protein GCM10023089_18150 [Quisquiliibacterium transsilvanicum]
MPCEQSQRAVKRETGSEAASQAVQANLCCPRNGKQARRAFRPSAGRANATGTPAPAGAREGGAAGPASPDTGRKGWARRPLWRASPFPSTAPSGGLGAVRIPRMREGYFFHVFLKAVSGRVPADAGSGAGCVRAAAIPRPGGGHRDPQ